MKKILFLFSAFAVWQVSSAQITGDCYLGGYAFSQNANNTTNAVLNGVISGTTDTTDKDGNSSSAYYFDGINDYIKIPHNKIIDSINQEFTLTMWIQPENNQYNTLLAKGSSDILIQLARYQRPSVLFPGSTLNYTGVENYYSRAVLYDSIKTDRWSFVAFTYSNIENKYTMNINGVEVISNSCSGSITVDTTSLYIGKRNNSKYPEYYKGKIDEVRLYCSALSSSDILSLYQGPNLSSKNLEISNSLNIYPNPSSSEISVSSSILIQTISIYNSVGKLVEVIDILKSKEAIINISSFTNGIYFAQVQNNDGTTSISRFIKN